MGDSPIGMPATRWRKPKPVAIWRAARFRFVLPIRYQAISTTPPITMTCQTMARNTGSDHEKRSAFFGAMRAPTRRGSAVASDISRSENRRRVLQAALGPDIVDAALDTHRRDVAVPHLAEIADLLDHVVGPFVVETERLAHVPLQTEQTTDVGIG